MNTFIIPNSALAAFINTHTTRVIARFEKETGHRVLFAGGGETSRGYRCVVVLEGVYANEKVLQELSNWPFANEAWWVEEGIPFVDDHDEPYETAKCASCGKVTNLSENDLCGNCERAHQAEAAG